MPLKPLPGHWPVLAMAAGGCALVALLLGSVAGQAMMGLVSVGGMAFHVETISGRKPPAGPQTHENDLLSSFGWNYCGSRFVACWMGGLELADGEQELIHVANEMRASDAVINLLSPSDYDSFLANHEPSLTILSPGFIVDNVITTLESGVLISAMGSGFTVQSQQADSVGTTRANSPVKSPIKTSDQQPMNAVPAPVPWLGLGVALGYCRRMRKRLSESQASDSIRVCSVSTSWPRRPPGQLK